MNLLTNADFHGPRYTPPGESGLDLPVGWFAGCIDRPQGSQSINIHYSEAQGRIVVALAPRHGLRNAPADVLKPEIGVITAVPPYLDPARTEPPDYAVQGFKSWGTVLWWIGQQVPTQPGRKYAFTFRAHAWQNDEGVAHSSIGVGVGLFRALYGAPGVTDAQSSYRFTPLAALDGTTNPLAPTIRWGAGVHIYNEFADAPALIVEATGPVTTFFILVDNLYGWLNSNAYLSRPNVEPVEGGTDLTAVWVAIGEIDERLDDLTERVIALEGGTPEPPPVPPPIIEHYNTGGIHAQDGNKSNLDAYLMGCQSAGYPVGLVKVLSDIGTAKRAKEISPQTITVWRKPCQYTSGDDQDNPPLYENLSPAQIAYIANRWMTKMYPVWRSPVDYLNPNGPKCYEFIDYFEITNEPNPALEQHVKNFNAFYLACMANAEAQPEHFKLALWSFSSGCPEPSQLEWMRSSLEYAHANGHLLAVHEGGVEPDKPHFHDNWNGTPEQGCALRYRMFKNHFGFAPRIVITEAYQIEGYHAPDWADWQWYLTELRRDTEVVGCAWFTLGNYEFSPGQSVNINGVLPGFVAPCVAAAQAEL